MIEPNALACRSETQPLLEALQSNLKTRLRISTEIKFSGDGVAQLLSLEALHHFILTMILETTRTAHPDHPALHFRGHQTPRMAMTTYIYVSGFA